MLLSSERVFKMKLKASPLIDKFNARFTVRGNNQKKDIYYFNMYFPLTKVAIVSALAAVTSLHDSLLHQMDLKLTFLNGDPDEKIFMRQAKGVIVTELA